MLTGELPFAGETTSDCIAAILKSEPAPLAQGTPAELNRIVRKALQKKADERYQTVKDLLLDLKSLERQLEFSEELERSRIPPSAQSANSSPPRSSENITAIQLASIKKQASATRQPSSAGYIVSAVKKYKFVWVGALAALIVALAVAGYFRFAASHSAPINSIAVLPFKNESGNPDVEYLSDGMTESLINVLSQLPKLSVKARSSVFRYKGKEADAKQVGADLNVQAVLNGRIIQRGNDLTLYLSLDDVQTGNQIWGKQYDRKLSDLVSLQNEIARDVSSNLQIRLSGAGEQKLARNYTESVEAYQLYLKGRFHVAKLIPSEIQTGILYFQQAITIDPSYALAYVGLANAYRTLAVAGEMPSTEFFPKAKAAAQRAIEIDETLAEAYAELGFIISWYDWDWNAAENHLKRALELNPNDADAHWFYAHLLSNTGRHEEALAEIRRAREIDPLSLRINANEGQFLLHAGQSDEALARLQKTFELDPNFWLAHLFAASAYIEKGMYVEAIAEARKARELSGASTHPTAFLAYALAKSGKQAEARSLLEELLKLSQERYVSPYNIALIHNGLGETDKALAWLEKGFQQRDPKMAFLKVERKWNNLRDDTRFQYLLRRVGFMP
jgi:TolB-like protein/Tfp pilus assembly protein PilF